jgi:hypothetical protein
VWKMILSETCAQEALKRATPLEVVEKEVTERARMAVDELRSYNEKYVMEHEGVDENFDYVKAEIARAEDPVVVDLSRNYLRLLNQRGLINV